MTVTYVSERSVATSTATTSHTIILPPSSAFGYLCVALANVRNTSGTISASAGWVSAAPQQTLTGAPSSHAIFYKFLTSADITAGDVTFTVSGGGSGKWADKLMIFSGVGAYLDGNSQINASSTTTTAPSINTENGGLQVWAGVIDQSASSYGNPTGFTLTATQPATAGGSGASQIQAAGAYRYSDATGTSGTVSATYSGSADVNVGFQISFSALTAPASVPTLTATAGSNGGRINLSWTDVAFASSYEVERDGVITSSISDTTFYDGLQTGFHSYRVRAVNDAGVSSWSSSQGATAPSATGSSFSDDFSSYSLGTDVATVSGYSTQWTATTWLTSDLSATAMVSPSDGAAISPGSGVSERKGLSRLTGLDGVVRAIVQMPTGSSGLTLFLSLRAGGATSATATGYGASLYYGAGVTRLGATKQTGTGTTSSIVDSPTAPPYDTWFAVEGVMAGSAITARYFLLSNLSTPVWEGTFYDNNVSSSGWFGMGQFKDIGAVDWLAIATDGSAIANWPGAAVQKSVSDTISFSETAGKAAATIGGGGGGGNVRRVIM